IAALLRRKRFEKFGCDSRSAEEHGIRPRGLSANSGQQNWLLLLEAGGEILIQNVWVRPELKRQPKNFNDIAAHAASGFFRLGDEAGQLTECCDLVAR